jgi:hypothetical protein
MDRVRPTRFDEAIDCGLNEDVPETEGIKNAGVEDRDRGLKCHGVA